MKTFGILLLFGLCTAIGFRAAEQKTKRIERIRALRRALASVSEAFTGGEGALGTIAQRGEGLLFEQLRAYIAAQAEGRTEEQAVCIVCEPFEKDAFCHALQLFFSGLSVCSRAQLAARIDALSDALSDAERGAAGDVQQAKLIRAVGVLGGAAIAVLLI